MGTFGLGHWLFLLVALSTVVPASQALRRVGLSPWWSILSVIPTVGWFALWAFAYAPWPKLRADSQAKVF